MREPRTHAAGEKFSDREKPLGKLQSVEDTPLGIEFTWKPDKKVMEAWREAGVFPKEAGEVVEKPSDPLELEAGTPTPPVRHRRRSSLPRGRVDDRRGGPGA